MSKKTYIKLKTEISNLRGRALEKGINTYLKDDKNFINRLIKKEFYGGIAKITLGRNGHNRMRAFFPSIGINQKIQKLLHILKMEIIYFPMNLDDKLLIEV
ncbi:MAG: hypothetical protein Q9M97_05215 [Candidatus Gracilibacteria bacterium]|nr:hypothetical protein [Candidatus Gracilibacteria bacterium]